MPNFEQCKQIFDNSTELQGLYNYTGPVQGIFRTLNKSSLPLLITVEGCRTVCGTGPEYYSWQDASSTISTWILPMVTLMLQAPFESNRARATMLAIARWVGSPIASLAYILWNVNITGKCAVMVDNATGFDEYPEEDSEYEQMRDSFYLLSVINQYSVKDGMPEEEAERLLRIVLFSNSLQLQNIEDESRSLIRRRRKLAKTIREFRRRSVVPILISFPWFLFSLVISIQAAFGQLGTNATAHNLALGLLMSWLPTLILFSIIDRNPVAAEAIRIKLNRIVDAVRHALLDEKLRKTYIQDIGLQEQDFGWTQRLDNEIYFQGDFFQDFAGQGRVRWHYGVAAPILAGIEESYIVRCGRPWLDSYDKARTHLVKGPRPLKGLQWFDVRALTCIGWAFLYVSAAVAGAFIISYCTPTVGLGCRSGGYLIFFSIATGSLLIEGFTWWLVPEGSEAPHVRLWATADRRLSQAKGRGMLPKIQKSRTWFSLWWRALTGRDVVEQLILRPLEVFNACWLLYCLLAQTFGAYQTCDCQSSTWGVGGKYMDFEDFEYYRANGVGWYWGVAVALSNTVMIISFITAATLWGEQSHMATENYSSAIAGLRRTRQIRRRMYRLRRFPHQLINILWRPILYLLARSGLYIPPSNRGRISWAHPTRPPPTPGVIVTAPTKVQLDTSNSKSLNLYNSPRGSDIPLIPRRPVSSRGSSPGLPSTPFLPDDDYAFPPGSSAMSRDASGSSQGSASPLVDSLGIGRNAHVHPFPARVWDGHRRAVTSDPGSNPHDTDIIVASEVATTEEGTRRRGRWTLDETTTVEMGLSPSDRQRVRSPRGSMSETAARWAQGAAGKAWDGAENEDALDDS